MNSARALPVVMTKESHVTELPVPPHHAQGGLRTPMAEVRAKYRDSIVGRKIAAAQQWHMGRAAECRVSPLPMPSPGAATRCAASPAGCRHHSRSG